MNKTVTVITMCRGYDAEMFCQVVDGPLTDEQKDKWREAHSCDAFYPEDADPDDMNNMFFREVEILPVEKTADLLNVDGGCWRDHDRS
jgi:hypothetical protein